MPDAIRLQLDLLPGRFAVARFRPDEPLPAGIGDADWCSVTRTGTEVSVVCRESSLPAGARAETGFMGLAVRGPLAFTETGVLASLVGPLAAAGISIFVLSTFDTDILFVRAPAIDSACDTLAAAGHTVHGRHKRP